MARKPVSLQSLFTQYANQSTERDIILTDKEMKQEKICLSQIDLWLTKAKLINKNNIRLTDTGVEFNKFKKYRLDYDEFVTFLENLCTTKKLDFDATKKSLIQAGPPI